MKLASGGTLAASYNPRSNNFDLLRLIAALVVLFSHSYSLSNAGWEPIGDWLHYGYGGTLAVVVFFVISGFLIAQSLETQPLPAYLRGRVLRILPGLALVTLIETFVIGPTFFEGQTSYYLRHYALHHLRNMLVFGEDPFIPNVFSKLKFPYVNGSLWTLPVESLFYLLLPLVVLIASSGRRWVILLLTIASLAAEPVARACGLSDDQFGGFLFVTVRSFAVAQFGAYFMAGVFAWTYRDRIPWNGGYFALCLLLLFTARGSLAGPFVLKLCLPYCVLYAGVRSGLGTRLKRKIGDLSYGVYLAGYPCINIVIVLTGQKLGPLAIFVMAASASLVFAWISWHLVERPALRLKRAHRVPEVSAAAPALS